MVSAPSLCCDGDFSKHPSAAEEQGRKIKSSFPPLRCVTQTICYPYRSIWTKKKKKKEEEQRRLMSLRTGTRSIPGSGFWVDTNSNSKAKKIWRLGPQPANQARQNDLKHTPIAVCRLQNITPICMRERAIEERERWPGGGKWMQHLKITTKRFGLYVPGAVHIYMQMSFFFLKSSTF